MIKVLVNSYPRSGTTTFTDAIRMSCVKKNIKFGEDFFHKDSWVAKSHIPVLFLGDFPPNITVATILRDPVDAITSNCFRWTNGYTGNIVQGKIVIDKSRENKENKFDELLKDLIRHQTEQYISYLYCLKNGSKNTIIFSYEDIQNNIVKCINRIVKVSNLTLENLDYDAAINIIKNPPQPTKIKTDLYYEIKQYLMSVDLLEECYLLYNDILTKKEIL